MKKFLSMMVLAVSLVFLDTGCGYLSKSSGTSQVALNPQQVTYKSLHNAIVAEDQVMKNWFRAYRVREKGNEALKDSNPSLYETNRKNLEEQVTKINIAHSSFQVAVNKALDTWITARVAAGLNVPLEPKKLVPVTSEVQVAIDRVNEVDHEQR